MVQGRWFPMGSDLSQPLAVRMAVFGTGRDALDDGAQQVAVYDGEQPVGSARLWWQDGAFWLGCVGVPEPFRGRGYGDLLVRLLLFKALTHSARVIRLEAPDGAAPFFAQYGFQPESSRDGHTVMRLLGADVRLSHCGGDCSACGHPGPECAPRALR